MANLNKAVAGTTVDGTFSSAASPGVVSLFFANEFYATDEEYLFAIAEAMRYEYETIAAGGARSRSTARTWRWGGIPRTPTWTSPSSVAGSP